MVLTTRPVRAAISNSTIEQVLQNCYNHAAREGRAQLDFGGSTICYRSNRAIADEVLIPNNLRR
jgi:hypothetical protein